MPFKSLKLLIQAAHIKDWVSKEFLECDYYYFLKCFFFRNILK